MWLLYWADVLLRSQYNENWANSTENQLLRLNKAGNAKCPFVEAAQFLQIRFLVHAYMASHATQTETQTTTASSRIMLRARWELFIIKTIMRIYFSAPRKVDLDIVF